MKRFISALLTAAFCLIPITAHAAIATDAVLYYNSAVICTLPQNDSLDLSFTPTEDGVYTFYSYDASGDPEATLYKVEGDELSYVMHNSDGGGNYNFKFNAELEADAAYVLRMTEYFEDTSSSCTVKVVTAQDYYNALAPKPITQDSTVTVSSAGGEQIYFEFTPEVDGWYNFYASSAEECDTYANLYKVNGGQLIDVAFDDDSAVDLHFSLTTMLTAGTTYALEVAHYNYSADAYTYTVGVTQNSAERESITAIPAALGDNTFTAANTAPRFSFIPDSDGLYCFSFDSEIVGEIHVTRIGALVEVGHIFSDVLSIDLVAGEEYIVTVYDFDGGTFNISVGAEITTEYTFDDANMLIRDIPAGVSVAEFRRAFSGDILISDAVGNEVPENKTVGTGFWVYVNGDFYDTVIKGDVTGDGQVNSTDFMQVRRHFLELYTVSGVSFIAGDTDDNGRLNSVDFMRIRNHYLGRYDLYN